MTLAYDEDLILIMKELKKINNDFYYDDQHDTIIGSFLNLKEIPEILLDCPYQVSLAHNEITSINGLIQNNAFNLSHNKITSMDGCIQKKNSYLLDLAFNNIKSINEFEQNSHCSFYQNDITELKDKKMKGDLILFGNNIKFVKDIDLNEFRLDVRSNKIKNIDGVIISGKMCICGNRIESMKNIKIKEDIILNKTFFKEKIHFNHVPSKNVQELLRKSGYQYTIKQEKYKVI